MSERLAIPGQVGIGVVMVPGPTAGPVGFPIQESPDQIRVVVAGGLTKRQYIATQIMAALLSRGGYTDPNEMTNRALTLTDVLLAATEPRNGVKPNEDQRS